MSVMGIGLSLIAMVIQLAVVAVWLLLLAASVRAFRRRQWIRGGIWGALFLALLLLFLLQVPTQSQKSPRSHCMGNLAQIGKAMVMYSMDNEETFPPNLAALTNCGANIPRFFVCPATRHKPHELSNVDEWTDFVYLPGLTATQSADCVLVFCPPENHGGKGANVLFVDGSVLWMNPEEFIAVTNSPEKFLRVTKQTAK